MRRRISCINKTDRYNPHERIRSVGGTEDGVRWKLSLDEAITEIERGGSFYVLEGGSQVEVIVVRGPSGHPYLKTTADGEQPDNLLALPECP